VQYLHWIGGLLHGDLGYSYVSEKPALQEILPRIPITARLAGLALLFSTSIGIPLGVISASIRARGLIIRSASSASAACHCRRSGSGC